jgi:hypothetical protein
MVIGGAAAGEEEEEEEEKEKGQGPRAILPGNKGPDGAPWPMRRSAYEQMVAAPGGRGLWAAHD